MSAEQREEEIKEIPLQAQVILLKITFFMCMVQKINWLFGQIAYLRISVCYSSTEFVCVIIHFKCRDGLT